MTRRMRIGSGTALTLARCPEVLRVRSRVVVVLFTSVGQRVDIVRAFRAAGAIALGVDADPLAPALYHCDRRVIVPRIADPGIRADARGAARGARRRPRRPPERPRLPRARARARAARACVGAPSGRRGVGPHVGQARGASLLRRARDPVPAELGARGRPGGCSLPRPRQGAGGVRLAQHPPCPRIPRSSRSSSGTRTFPPSCRRCASARSSRSTSSRTWRAAVSTRSRGRCCSRRAASRSRACRSRTGS